MTTDEFARILAQVAAELPAGHLAAWVEVLDAATHPTTAVEAALIDARPGYTVAGTARRLMDSWRNHASHLPGTAVGLALRSAANVHQHTRSRRTTLAISGPSSPSVPVRLTSSVIVEVIRAAHHHLLVVSFAAYGVAEVLRELVAAAGRGVHIDLVLEEAHADGGALRGQAGAAAAFSILRDQATFWHWPAHQRPTSGNSRAALHAKLVAADTSTALISSANLTDRAMSTNLEVGVVLRDPDVVSRLVAHFTALMAPDNGTLQPLP